MLLNEKRICRRTAMTLATVALTVAPIFADDAPQNFTQIVQPIVDLLNSMISPLLLIVGAVGAIYCILLGVKYARAEEPQDREKAKAHLKGAIIGFVLIFVLIVLLSRLLPYMTAWATKYNTKIK